ncbi:hypothetical protein PIB30_090399, partial [Stylosanthes scabra]|nr:hypothetical protein [Stylosanthes scabra]
MSIEVDSLSLLEFARTFAAVELLWYCKIGFVGNTFHSACFSSLELLASIVVCIEFVGSGSSQRIRFVGPSWQKDLVEVVPNCSHVPSGILGGLDWHVHIVGIE